MRYRNLFYFFFIILMLTGCSSLSSNLEDTKEDPSSITVGNILEIQNTNNRMVLLDHKETLAAEGLYYLSWGIDRLESDKDTTEDTVQYNAQLYLLLGEAKNGEEAQHNLDNWIAAAKTNYEIIAEKEISCNQHSYSVLLYNRNIEDNIYSNGLSAFCTIDHIALCVELICTENFTDDLETILTNFLNDCSYHTE